MSKYLHGDPEEVRSRTRRGASTRDSTETTFRQVRPKTARTNAGNLNERGPAPVKRSGHHLRG